MLQAKNVLILLSSWFNVSWLSLWCLNMFHFIIITVVTFRNKNDQMSPFLSYYVMLLLLLLIRWSWGQQVLLLVLTQSEPEVQSAAECFHVSAGRKFPESFSKNQRHAELFSLSFLYPLTAFQDPSRKLGPYQNRWWSKCSTSTPSGRTFSSSLSLDPWRNLWAQNRKPKSFQLQQI